MSDREKRAPPTHPAFDIDIYDCPCGHPYGDHDYRWAESFSSPTGLMIIDHCVACVERDANMPKPGDKP